MKHRDPMMTRDDGVRIVGLALAYALLVMIGALVVSYVHYDNAMPIYRPAKVVTK